jgi:MarR family transcriptional regulator for hemolysin
MVENGKPDARSVTRFADPNNSVGYLTRIAFRAFSRALERRTMPFGVSAGQWRFLRQLWIEDGLTQRELSQRVSMREPTTVTAVNSLVRSGFVDRVPSVSDRRKIHIYLTARGRELQAALLPFVAEVNDLASKGVDPAEMDIFVRVLGRINANLTEEADEPLVYGADV